MKKNAERLREVRDHLAYNPNLHKQGTWGTVKRSAIDTTKLFTEEIQYDWGSCNKSFYAVSCGSTACCAGHTVLLAGDQFLLEPEELEEARESGTAANVAHCRDTEGVVHLIPERARELLGLTDMERFHLFASTVSRKRVLELLDGYIKEAESEE